MSSDTGLILSCSPRPHGNCEAVSRLLAGELGFPVMRLASRSFKPCIACGYCDTRAGSCSLDKEGDEARALLESLCTSPAGFNVLVSPIYFYHLPALLKGLMDRSQRWWNVAEKPAQNTRLAVVLLGARPRGDKLFAGALLSLKYMALTMGLELAEPLLLYSLDAPDAFARNDEAQAKVRDYARALLRSGEL